MLTLQKLDCHAKSFERLAFFWAGFLWAILAVAAAHGQSRGRVAYSIYKENLSQIQITRMCEDPSGRIWAGTKDGISIFDPETHTFQNPYNHPLLRSGVINDIALDRRGKIWYATRRGIFSEDGDSLMLPGYQSLIPEVDICFDRYNRLWYVSEPTRRAYCVVGNRRVPIDSLVPELRNRDIANIRYDSAAASIGLITTDGREIYSLNEGSMSVQRIQLEPMEYLILNHREELYSLKSNGLFKIGANGKRTWIAPLPKIYWNSIQYLDIDAEGTIYFGRNHHLFEARNGVPSDYGTQFRLITSVMVSEKGPIYVGTEEGLVAYHYPRFHFWDSRDNVNYPWSVLRDQKGTIWYSGYTTGLFRFDTVSSRYVKDSSYFPLFNLPGKYPGCRELHHMGSKISHDGDLMFATACGVLLKQGDSYRFLNADQNGGSFFVFDILEDTAQQRILVGSHEIIESGRNGDCRPLSKGRNVFRNRFFLDLEIGPNGRIWVGGTSQLGYLEGDSIVEYPYGGGGFPIHFDHRKLLWASGKWGEGLWALEPERRYSQQIAPNFIQRMVSTIWQIDSTYLLVGAVDGLYVLKLDEFYRSQRVFLAHYDHHNGLIGNECGQNSFFQDQKTVFFVTEDAIQTIDCEQFKHELGYPLDTTHIEVVRAEETTTETRLAEGGKERPSFRFDHNRFKFQFACADGGPFSLRYVLSPRGNPDQVLLEGVSGSGEVELAGLSKGRYRLSVKPDLNGRKLVLAREMTWEFEVRDPWLYWGVFLAGGIALTVLLGITTMVIYRQRNRVDLLLGELSHRVGNNLGIIRRIVATEARRPDFNVANLVLRIEAFVKIHHLLSAQNQKGSVPIQQFIADLATELRTSFSLRENDFLVDLEGIGHLDWSAARAERLGLMVNEVVTNAYKHAAAQQGNVVIKISMKRVDHKTCVLAISDNGNDPTALERLGNGKTYGWRFIQGLAAGLDSKPQLSYENGMVVRFVFAHGWKARIPKVPGLAAILGNAGRRKPGGKSPSTVDRQT